ncbi:WhiB family transcriptional regulator [Micromonospora sp. NPDC018662]|uniref:WhiB family transcriptional regulator n=1 Tax=Micromonospora sp. NPDC018662 TaxID=3364238 RepID=UPI003788D9B7
MSERAVSAPPDWWRQAACAGSDANWWTGDCPDRIQAVRICLGCPVREACLADGLANGDTGVVRGGVMLHRSRRRTEVIHLVCAQCGCQPVRFSRTYQGLYCGRRCSAIARSRRAADRRDGPVAGDHRRPGFR